MIKDYKIITLCGSTRFKEQFLETTRKMKTGLVRMIQ